jgi:hypothetical protein
MSTEETNKKEDRTKPESSGPMGPGMFEMMTKCRTGEKAFADCAAMMKSKMAAMTSMPCCGPGTEENGPDRRGK